MLHCVGRRAVYTTHNRILARCLWAPSSQTLPNTPSPSTPSWKKPTRGGQNLSERYHRLEKSLRGKELYQREIQDLQEEAGTATSSAVPRPARKVAKTFMGYVIPEEPQPPGPDECCMSGCAICVQDLYAKALEEYRKAVDSLRASLTMLRIPEDQWPESISPSKAQSKPAPNVSLNAFEELERRLREKENPASSHAVEDARSKRVDIKRNWRAEVGSMYEGVRWVLFSNR